MDEQSKNNQTKIRRFFSFAGTAFSGIVVLVATILYIYADKVFDASGNFYRYAIYITIGAYVVVFVSTIIVLVIFKVRLFSKKTYDDVVSEYQKGNDILKNSIFEISEIKRELSDSLVVLSNNLNKEQSLISQIEIDQFVLNGKAVIELESSVGNYCDTNKRCKIYIQTSQFLLEKGPLEDTILWNLRKGVKYIYIIPKSDVYINEYYEMLRDWYSNYSSFLMSEENYDMLVSELDMNHEYKKYWCREYQCLFNEAGDLWKDIRITEKERNRRLNECREQCKKLFESQIEAHVEEDSEFYITVAVYEIKRSKWEAIIKLPTQNVNDEYYAFQVPSGHRAELNEFIHNFQNRYKSCVYDPANPSTFGGKLNLNFTYIFS